MFCIFFLKATATPGIYPLSLHGALPIWRESDSGGGERERNGSFEERQVWDPPVSPRGQGCPLKVKSSEGGREAGRGVREEGKR